MVVMMADVASVVHDNNDKNGWQTHFLRLTATNISWQMRHKLYSINNDRKDKMCPLILSASICKSESTDILKYVQHPL